MVFHNKCVLIKEDGTYMHIDATHNMGSASINMNLIFKYNIYMLLVLLDEKFRDSDRLPIVTKVIFQLLLFLSNLIHIYPLYEKCEGYLHSIVFFRKVKLIFSKRVQQIMHISITKPHIWKAWSSRALNSNPSPT